MIGHVGKWKMNLLLEDTIEGAQLGPMFLMTHNLIPYMMIAITRGDPVPMDTILEAMRLGDINPHAENTISLPNNLRRYDYSGVCASLIGRFLITRFIRFYR